MFRSFSTSAIPRAASRSARCSTRRDTRGTRRPRATARGARSTGSAGHAWYAQRRNPSYPRAAAYPAQPSPLDRGREDERVRHGRCAAHVERGGRARPCPLGDVRRAGLLPEHRRVVVDEAGQLGMPVAGVGDAPVRRVPLDHLDRRQRLPERVLVDPEVGLLQPAVALQVALEVIEECPPRIPECIGLRRPRDGDERAGALVPVAEAVRPGQRGVDRDRAAHTLRRSRGSIW